MRMKGFLPLTLLILGCSREEARSTGATRSAEPGSASATTSTSPVEVTPVVVQPLDTTTHLEGELAPYEDVIVRARANGFVNRVLVDRGNVVKAGQLLLTIAAPELSSQRAEAEAKQQSDKSTFERLKSAAQTPGAVASHEVEVAEAAFRADEARVRSLRDLESYLAVAAPFDGVVTERNVHPGALVGPQGEKTTPLLRVQQVAKLRLTVSIPESFVGAVSENATATFTVRAYPGEKFSATTRRISHSVDPKTRTMPVELDVDNPQSRLAPGMFADVFWPVKRSTPTTFVPPSAIVQSTEKTFVVRVRDEIVDQVTVQRGVVVGDLVEVFGQLQPGDLVARRGSEELKNGAHVTSKVAAKTGEHR